jgi:hypothetical protein
MVWNRRSDDASRVRRGDSIAGRDRAGGTGPVRRGSVGPNSATTGVPNAAATCIGPVSLLTISSLSRIHSTISGKERRPVKSRHRAGSARAMTSPSGRSSSPPRMANRNPEFAEASSGTSSANSFDRPAFVRASARRAGEQSTAPRPPAIVAAPMQPKRGARAAIGNPNSPAPPKPAARADTSPPRA